MDDVPVDSKNKGFGADAKSVQKLFRNDFSDSFFGCVLDDYSRSNGQFVRLLPVVPKII